MDSPGEIVIDTRSGYSDTYLSVEAALEKVFDKWARVLSSRSWCFMFAAICICAATATGAYYVEFNNDPSEIWVPLDSPAVDDRDTVEDYFGDSVKRLQIYITSASDKDKDILSKYFLDSVPFEQLYEFDKLFKELTYDGINYYEICEKTQNDNTVFFI
jgi:hypothetical protein